jgi:hypothetical protein
MDKHAALAKYRKVRDDERTALDGAKKRVRWLLRDEKIRASIRRNQNTGNSK